MASGDFFIWDREQPFEKSRFTEDKSFDFASSGFGIISRGFEEISAWPE
jgi:hypothetical protein